jgi:hypothetical protein
VFGLVERFNESVDLFNSALSPIFPGLKLRKIRRNSLRGDKPLLGDRLSDISEALDQAFTAAW